MCYILIYWKAFDTLIFVWYSDGGLAAAHAKQVKKLPYDGGFHSFIHNLYREAGFFRVFTVETDKKMKINSFKLKTCKNFPMQILDGLTKIEWRPVDELY